MSLSHFYLSVPSADGIFKIVTFSENFKEASSLYEFELFSDASNRAYFWLAPEAVKWALEDVSKRIEPVCKSENNLTKKASDVKIIEKGIAELHEVSGNWKMVERVKIEYLEINEREEQAAIEAETRKTIAVQADEIEKAKKEKEETEAKNKKLQEKLEAAERIATAAKKEVAETKRIAEEAKAQVQEKIGYNPNQLSPTQLIKIQDAEAKAAAALEALKKAEYAQKKAEADAEKLKQKQAKQSSSPRSSGGCLKRIGYILLILIALGAIGTLSEKIDILEQIKNIFNNNKSDFSWYTSNPNAKNFTISTAKELASLAQIVNGTWGKEPKSDNFAGKIITLGGNIDLSQNNNWVPIGNNSADPNNVFSGTFNGGGYVINNLTINRPEADFQGLFGHISGGKVQNLGLDNVNVAGRDTVGGIAGIISKGSGITNSYSIGWVNGKGIVGSLTGAIVNNSGIANSYSSGKVSGEETVGGLAGMLRDNSSIAYSYSAAAVNGQKTIAGVAGAITGNSTVANCAALNSEVKGVEAGRVVSNAWKGFTLSNNVAYNEMKNNAGNTEWKRKGATARDGADITTAAINRDGTIGGRFIAKNGWKVENGSLPEFVRTVALQEQKTGELEPIYIIDSNMYYIPVKDENGLHKYITLEGKNITETKYARAYVFREGRALVQEKDSTWGYIDTEGNSIARGYTQGLSFREGIAWVNDNGVIKAIDLNGGVVKFLLIQDIVSVWAFYEDLALYSANGMQNYLDKDFNEISRDYFLDGNRFQENMASVMCDNGKYRYIDKNLEHITNCIYDEARVFKNSRAIVRVDNGLGIIDREGKYILQPSNNMEMIIQDEDMFKFKEKNGNWGWLNSSGKVAIQPIFEEIMSFGNRNLAPVRQGSLWGYIDRNGKYVLDLQYKVAYPFINERAFVKFEDTYFVTIDKNGIKDLQTKYQKFDNSYWEIMNSDVATEPKIMTIKPSSFSCDKKAGNDEKTAIRIICKSFNLIELDNKMSKLYADKKNNPDFTESNKTFLSARNNCKDIYCLQKVYEARIKELARETPEMQWGL